MRAQVVSQFESVMDSWINEVEKLLADVDMPRRDANDVGPASELEYAPDWLPPVDCEPESRVDVESSHGPMWIRVVAVVCRCGYGQRLC